MPLTFISNFKRQIVANSVVCVVFLGIVLAIEIIIHFTATNYFKDIRQLEDFRFYEPNAPIMMEKSIVQWQIFNALNNNEKVDILILGDCSALYGLDPKVITAQTGLSAWNIGTLGGVGFPGQELILRLFLSNNQKPKILILNTSLTGLTRDDGEGWAARINQWTYYFQKTYQDFLIPSYAARELFYFYLTRNIVVADTKDIDYESKDFNSGVFINDKQLREILAQGQGYMAADRSEKFLPISADLNGFSGDSLEKKNLSRIMSIVQLAKQNGIQIFVTVVPVPETFRSAKTIRAIANAYEGMSAALAGQEVRMKEFEFYSDDKFHRRTHLSRDGAREFSVEIAKWISRSSNGR